MRIGAPLVFMYSAVVAGREGVLSIRLNEIV